MCPNADRRSNKSLNNRAENAHRSTRRKEKSLIKFKSAQGVQTTLSLMGKVRNIFAIDIGRYTKNAENQRPAFVYAKSLRDNTAQRLLAG